MLPDDAIVSTWEMSVKYGSGPDARSRLGAGRAAAMAGGAAGLFALPFRGLEIRGGQHGPLRHAGRGVGQTDGLGAGRRTFRLR